MRSHDGARFVNDLTLASCRSAIAQQAAVVAVGHEADLLALWLLGSDEPTRSGYLANFRFRHATEWEPRPRDCSTVESVEEVGLVLLGIDSGTQSPGASIIRDGATRIVAGGNSIATKESAPLPNERAKLHRRIAANARARCLTALIRSDERFQYGIGELSFKVLNVEWDAEMVGDAPCVVSGIKGAATLAVTVTLIGGAVQAHPNTNDLMAGLDQECRSDR
jgi:hypothetical protein